MSPQLQKMLLHEARKCLERTAYGFRQTELTTRQERYYDAADWIRQVGDFVESDGVHKPPSTPLSEALKAKEDA